MRQVAKYRRARMMALNQLAREHPDRFEALRIEYLNREEMVPGEIDRPLPFPDLEPQAAAQQVLNESDSDGPVE